MILSKIKHLRLYTLICILALASCGGKQETTLPQETATTGTFELIADEAIKPAIDSLVIGFNSIYKDAKVTVRYKNATEALDDLLQHRARIVIVGRALSARERASLEAQKVTIPEWEIAINPIGCVVNSKLAKDSISMDEIHDELTGKTDTYNKIITSYLGSTEGILDSIFARDTGTLHMKSVHFSTSDSLLAKVASDDKAMGFVSAAWLDYFSKKNGQSVKALDISNGTKTIMMHLAYVYQGIYPLTGRVMGYTFEQPNSLPRGFLAYVMAGEGQRVLLNHQLLPKTQIIKLIPPKR